MYIKLGADPTISRELANDKVEILKSVEISLLNHTCETSNGNNRSMEPEKETHTIQHINQTCYYVNGR